MTPIKKIFLRIFVFLLSLCLISLVLEIGLRLFYPQVKYDYPPGAFRSHPVRGYEWTPGFRGTVVSPDFKVPFLISSQGFRVPLSTPRSGDTGWTIVGVGDSLTFGKGVSYEDCWLGVLEKITGQKTANLGVDAYSPIQSFSNLEEKWPLFHSSANTVIFAITLDNDFDDILRDPQTVRYGILFLRDDADAMKTWSRTRLVLDRIKIWFALHSDLYQFLRRRIRAIPRVSSLLGRTGLIEDRKQKQERFSISNRILLGQDDVECEAALSRWRELVEKVALFRDKNEVNVIFVLLPSVLQYEPKAAKHAGTGFVREIPGTITTPLRKFRFTWIDPSEQFRAHAGTSLRFPHDGHWTPEGHRLVANAIAGSIARSPSRSQPEKTSHSDQQRE